ncbi:zinc finger FYVE-type containing 26 spastizin [Oratosquilla oratoria]|uniref:zinc finger FYVE-type containing 26 spastizin n=1 Tax=Oratosquilla oratoria TaxID=337810 RepID=UPI003F770C8F
MENAKDVTRYIPKTATGSIKEELTLCLLDAERGSPLKGHSFSAVSNAVETYLKKSLIASPKRTCLLIQKMCIPGSSYGASRNHSLNTVVVHCLDHCLRRIQDLTSQQQNLEEKIKKLEEKYKRCRSSPYRSSRGFSQQEERIEIAEKERYRELIRTYEHEKDINERTFYSIILSWHSFDPYSCTELIQVLLDLCHGKKLFNIFQLYCCLLASGKEALNSFCKPEENYICEVQERLVHEKRWEKEEKCDNTQCSYLVPLDCKTLSVICVGRNSHILKEIVDNFSLIPDTLISSKKVESWIAHYPAWLGPLWPFFFHAFWLSATDKVSSSQHLSLLWDKRPCEGDPVFVKASHSLKRDLRTLHWCIEHSNTLHVASLLKLVCDFSPLYALNKAVPFHRLNDDDVMHLLEEYEKGEGKNAETAVACKMTFMAYTLMANLMLVLSAGMHLDNGVTGRKLRNRKVRHDDENLLDSNSCYSSRLVDINAMKAYYQTSIVKRLEEIKEILGRMQPLAYKVEIIENMFSMLFVRHSDLSDEILSDSGEEGGEFEKSTLSHCTDLDSSINFPVSHTSESTINKKFTEEKAENGSGGSVRHNGWRAEKKRASFGARRILDADETAAVNLSTHLKNLPEGETNVQEYCKEIKEGDLLVEEPLWKVEGEDVSSDCERWKSVRETRRKHKTKGKGKKKSVTEAEKGEYNEEALGNVESDSSTAKRQVEDTQSSATHHLSSGTSAKSTTSSFRELPRTGFLGNVLVTWDILLLLKDAVVEASAEIFASHSKEVVSGGCNVRMSIKRDSVKSRLSRISKYVNDALWRLSVVCPRIREFGSLNEFEDYCSGVLLLTGPPSPMYQSVISDSSNRLSESEGTKKRTRLVFSSVKTDEEYSVANFLLASPSTLISVALANNNLIGAHQVVQAFNMKECDDRKEVEFTDRFAELKPKILQCEAVKRKNRVDTKALASGTKTLHGLGLLAREGMAQVCVTNIINDLITATPPPVPPHMHNLIGAVDQYVDAVVRTFQIPQAMVYADVALTHDLSYSTAIQLLEMVLQRVSSQDRSSFVHCKLGVVGYVPIVRQMNELSSAFKNIAASGTKATLVKACGIQEGTPHHLLLSCLPLTAHSLTNFFTNWAKMSEHIKTMEDLLHSEVEDARSSTSIHKLYKKLLLQLREEHCCLAGREADSQQVAYLRTFYQYLQLLSVMVDRHTDDQTKSSYSYFKLLNQRPVHILGSLMFEKGVKPSVLEPITLRMCLNLTNVILQYSCPKLTIPKTRAVPDPTRLSMTTLLQEIGCQIDGKRIILNAGSMCSQGDVYGDVTVRNVLGTLKATLCEMIEFKTWKKLSTTAQVVDDAIACHAMNSPDIQMSLRETSDLISADLTKLSLEEDKLTFFINLANLMFLHAVLVNHLVYSCQQHQRGSRGLLSCLPLERLIAMKRYGYIVGNLGFLSLYDVIHEYLEQSNPGMMLLQGKGKECILSSLVSIPHMEKKRVEFDVPMYVSFLLTTGSIMSPKIQVVYSDRVAEQGTMAMNEYVASHLSIQQESASFGQNIEKPRQGVSLHVNVTKTLINAANKNPQGLFTGILDLARQNEKRLPTDWEELKVDVIEDDQSPGISLEFGCEQEPHGTIEMSNSVSEKEEEEEEKEELYDSWHWKKINVPHNVLSYLEKKCSPLAKLVSSLHDKETSKTQENIGNSKAIIECIRDATCISPRISSQNVDVLDTAKKPVDYLRNLFYMNRYRVLSVLHQGSCTVAALKTKIDVEDLWLVVDSILNIGNASDRKLILQEKGKQIDQATKKRSSVQSTVPSDKEIPCTSPVIHHGVGIASLEAAEAAVDLLDSVTNSEKELYPDLLELQDIILFHLAHAATSQDGASPWKYTWQMRDANLRNSTVKCLLSWFPLDAAMSQLSALSSDILLSEKDRTWAYNRKQQLHVYGEIVKADLGYCSWQEVEKISHEDPGSVLKILLQKQLFAIGVAWARNHTLTPQLQCLVDQSFLLTLLHVTDPDFKAASDALDQLGNECVEPVVAILLEKISDTKVRRFLIEFVIKWFLRVQCKDNRAADDPDRLVEEENVTQVGDQDEEKLTERKKRTDEVKIKVDKDEKTVGDVSRATLLGGAKAKKGKSYGGKRDAKNQNDKIVNGEGTSEEVKDNKTERKSSGSNKTLDMFELNQECMGLLLVEDIAPQADDKFQLYHLSKTPLLMFEQWLMNIRVEAVEQGVGAISGYLDAMTQWQEKGMQDSYRYIRSRGGMLTWDSYNALVEHYAAKALDTSGVQMMPKGSKTKTCQQDIQFTMPPSPPKPHEWMPDYQVKYCTVCNVSAFSLFCRRHHCRRCGRVVCGSCSKARMEVEGYMVKVRVCSDCFRQSREINLNNYVQVRPLGDDPSEISPSETSDELQSPQGSTTLSFESEGGWYLTQQAEHNSLVRSEFSYDYAPSLSLSLAIFSLHRRPQQAALCILQLCHNLLVLFSSSISSPNVEVDHTFLLSMVHTLFMAAKLRFANANDSHGINACEFIEERVELFNLLIKTSCAHLIANAPVKNAVRLVELRIRRLKGEAAQDQDEINRLMKNEFTFFRRIRDALVREQQWNLALTVSTKRGFETQSVLSSWGLTCLKAGDFTGARERLSRVLQRPVDKNKGFMSSLLPVIIRELERNNITAGQLVIEQVEQLPTMLLSKDQQSKLPAEALLIQWCRETQGTIEMGRLGEPVGLSDTFATRLSTKKKNFSGRLHPHFLKECKYYLRLYGSHSMNIQFLIRHNLLQDCLDYVINEEPGVSIFVEDVFLPLLRDGHIEKVILLMRSVDPQLQNWAKYLRGACLFLEKNQWWYSLLFLQENLKDYLRAAMTLHRLYLFCADSYLSLQNHVHFLTAAIKHLKAHLDGQSWVKPHKTGVGEATALKYDLPGRTVNRHINTFSLQGDVVKVLAAWEQGGAPIQPLLLHMNELGLKVYSHNDKRMPTLLADKVEALAVVMLLLLCGKSMEDGSGLAYRVLETIALSPKSMLTLGAKLLVVTQRYSEVGQLVQVASEWGLQKATSVDAALQPAIMLARKPPHQPNLDLLVRLLTSDTAKVNTYIECGRLKSAYLVAVHGSRWDHVTKVKEAAEKSEQRHVAVMCEKWMASFNYRVRK